MTPEKLKNLTTSPFLPSASLVAMICLSACERMPASATRSPVPARRMAAPRSAKTNVVDARAEAASGPGASRERRPHFFDLNGYRHSYVPRISAFSFGLVVIGSADELWKARRLARKAHAALGLPYQELRYEEGNFKLPRSACVESGYCIAEGRYAEYRPFAYITIEHSGGYESLDSKTFVVLAAHGPPGSDLLSKTLAKAQAVFPGAYQKTTRALWEEYSYSKLPNDMPPANQGATQR